MHKFAIPEDFCKIIRTAITSLVDAQIRELLGSGRAGNYAIYRTFKNSIFKYSITKIKSIDRNILSSIR